ncbi:MAG: hypothetical protein ACFKPT_04395 [Gloeotrichia echinulata GP01]
MFTIRRFFVVNLLVLSATGCTINIPASSINPSAVQTPSQQPITPVNNPPSASNQYPPETVKLLFDSCNNKKDGQQLTDGQQLAFCTCFINKIQQTYTYNQFLVVSQNYNQTSKFPPEMVNILTSCLNTSLNSLNTESASTFLQQAMKNMK